jgi:hypothetical protein
VRRAARIVLVSLLCLAAKTQAQAPSCADPDAAFIALREAQAGSELALDEIQRHLAAGFAASGVAVCAGEAASQRRVAEVEIDAEPAGPAASRAVLRIRVKDAVTSKTLERSVDLAATPEDSRTLLVALYVEELVQASWIETTLRDRIHLREHPVATPPEVQREVDAVLPAIVPPSHEPRFRLSFSGAVAYFETELIQAGPELSFGWRVLPWLELSLRAGYRLSPTTSAPNGTIDVRTLLGGLFIDAFWRTNTKLSLHFPQGMDAARVQFVGHPRADAEASTAVRPALVVSHGVGLRVVMTPWLSLGALARFCWTLLPAEAADDLRAVTGVSGLGGEGTLSFDTHF